MLPLAAVSHTNVGSKAAGVNLCHAVASNTRIQMKEKTALGIECCRVCIIQRVKNVYVDKGHVWVLGGTSVSSSYGIC